MGNRTFPPKNLSSSRVSAWLMVVLILATFWIRVWRLTDIPPAFNYDEAYNAVDARWLWKTGSPLVYLPGNTGRQALFHHLIALSMTLLGKNVFAVRFVSAVIGVMVVPLMYRWVITMLDKDPRRYMIALLGGAGLTFSFWHIALSRSGFRASLFHFLFVLTAYLFWQGWRRQSNWYIAGAGVALGLCQYTYWLAGLLPLQFGLFGLVLTLLAPKKALSGNGQLAEIQNIRQVTVKKAGLQPVSRESIASVAPSIRSQWLWIGIMALSSFVVFIPLGVSYVNDPTALGYVSQSSIIVKDDGTNQGLSSHLLNSVRIFIDGPVGLWQGQLNQALSFDWLALVGFWLGLITLIKRWRYPPYLFLLTGLFILWLPAPLNDIDFSDLRLPAMLPVHHAISNLRVAGVLPIYYVVAAIGLLTGLQWAGGYRARQKFGMNLRSSDALIIRMVILVVAVSGSLNTYSFFYRWPQQPSLYERYNGPIFDLAQDILHESQNHDILIPFQLYTHPTFHFVLDDIFTESDMAPVEASHDSAILVTTEQFPETAYIWLVRSNKETGVAYLTPNQNTNALRSLRSKSTVDTLNFAAPLLFSAQRGAITNIDSLRPQLTNWSSMGEVNYNWNGEIALVGYNFDNRQIESGQSLNITLYWQNLIDQPLTHDVFIHAINGRGEGVGQVDGVEITDGHRWRSGKVTPTHHTLNLDDSISPGPYLLRMGLFNARTGNRVPIVDEKTSYIGNEALFGLFYVTEGKQASLQPASKVEAVLGQQIRLLGYTLPEGQAIEMQPGRETLFYPMLYWQADSRVNKDYTIFVQVLDDQNQRITGFDTQPINGNYPTSRWQPQEAVVEQIPLSLPADLAAGEYRLVTGMYNFQTGRRLETTGQTGEPLADNMIVLANIKVSAGQLTFSMP